MPLQDFEFYNYSETYDPSSIFLNNHMNTLKKLN